MEAGVGSRRSEQQRAQIARFFARVDAERSGAASDDTLARDGHAKRLASSEVDLGEARSRAARRQRARRAASPVRRVQRARRCRLSLAGCREAHAEELRARWGEGGPGGCGAPGGLRSNADSRAAQAAAARRRSKRARAGVCERDAAQVALEARAKASASMRRSDGAARRSSRCSRLSALEAPTRLRGELVDTSAEPQATRRSASSRSSSGSACCGGGGAAAARSERRRGAGAGAGDGARSEANLAMQRLETQVQLVEQERDRLQADAARGLRS